MKSFHKTLAIISLAIFVASCGSTSEVFTQQMREKYKLDSEDLKSLQFYVSGDIVLTRYTQGTQKGTEDGALNLIKDQVLESILIKSGTPCLIKEVIDGNRVTMTFEDGDNRYLVFGSLKNRDGAYTLQALDWNKELGGKLSYGDKEYFASSESRGAFLYLKVKSLNRFREDQKVVKGKTLN